MENKHIRKRKQDTISARNYVEEKGRAELIFYRMTSALTQEFSLLG